MAHLSNSNTSNAFRLNYYNLISTERNFLKYYLAIQSITNIQTLKQGYKLIVNILKDIAVFLYQKRCWIKIKIYVSYHFYYSHI